MGVLQTAFTAVPLTSQHPLEKAHVAASSSALIVLWLIIFPEEIQQPTIDVDICNVSSSSDVVYKERL
jgi:hypothetical protein